MKTNYFLAYKSAFFLLTALILFGHGIKNIQAEEFPIRERLISIDVQDQEFAQALEAVLSLTELEINISGDMPAGVRTLKFEDVRLDQVIAEVAKSYGILDYVVAFNSEAQQLTMVILKSASAELDLPFPEGQHVEFWETPLSSEQIRQLDDYDDIGSPFPLTAEQIGQLDCDDGLSKKSLTKEQMEQLEFEPQDQTLTVEQMRQLDPDEGFSNKILTPEQMRQLE